MNRLDLLWWVGWTYFAAWVALPLVAMPYLGAAAGVALWALLAPWSALAGMAAIHRLLQELLGLPVPSYHHHRLILDADGRKLSKSRGDTSIAALRAVRSALR